MFNIADELCSQCMRADWRRKGSTPSPSIGIPFRIIYSRQKRDDRAIFYSKPSVLRLRPRLFRFSEKTYCSECSSLANRNERKRGSIWKQGIVSQVDEWRVKNANEKYFADEFYWSNSVAYIINVLFILAIAWKLRCSFPYLEVCQSSCLSASGRKPSCLRYPYASEIVRSSSPLPRNNSSYLERK